MKPRARSTRVAPVLALATLVGCGKDAGSRDAGAVLEAPEPADATDDTQPAVLAVDFTVSGCATYDVGKPQCRGKAPLTLAFVPIASGDIKHFRWNFGDSYETSDTTPVHTYT